MERWCLCKYCVGAIKSRGERLFTRPMEIEDFTDIEYETDTVICDFCKEEFDPCEMSICS